VTNACDQPFATMTIALLRYLGLVLAGVLLASRRGVTLM
jgi:hypothetical protein